MLGRLKRRLQEWLLSDLEEIRVKAEDKDPILSDTLNMGGGRILNVGAPAVAGDALVKGTRLTMTEMPDGPKGQVLTAWGAGVDPVYSIVASPTLVRKAADEIVTNSTSFQFDDHLFFAVGANEVWTFDLYLRIMSPSAADFRYSFSRPSGGTLLISRLNSAFAATDSTDVESATSAFIITTTTGQERVVHVRLLYIGSANAGNIRLRWTQRTADHGETKVLANSYIIAYRLF